MKAIIATDQAAGFGGMKLVERPDPQPAINDVIVEVHASGFVPTELEWPSTWTDRRERDRTPSIPGHEFSGIVTALGYGTTGLSAGSAYSALPTGIAMARSLNILPSRRAIWRHCRVMSISRWAQACRSLA